MDMKNTTQLVLVDKQQLYERARKHPVDNSGAPVQSVQESTDVVVARLSETGYAHRFIGDHTVLIGIDQKECTAESLEEIARSVEGRATQEGVV